MPCLTVQDCLCNRLNYQKQGACSSIIYIDYYLAFNVTCSKDLCHAHQFLAWQLAGGLETTEQSACSAVFYLIIWPFNASFAALRYPNVCL
jgi:hypothetical protein